MKAKDISINASKEENKGKRGYRVEYDTMKDGKLKLKSLVLLEKNGAEAEVLIGDVVSFLFSGIDEQMAKYEESMEGDKAEQIDELISLGKKKGKKK